MQTYPWIPWLRAASDWIGEPLLYGVGLILLADLPALARKTALWGTPALHDGFSIVPGMHKQKDIARLTAGEYPACAAMTTGYVFRIENEAMVHYMQRVGRPGQLTTLSVSSESTMTKSATAARYLYTTTIFMTCLALAMLSSIDDYAALSAFGILLAVSIANMALIDRRAKLGWKGAKEPGVKSDLVVLLSQDRWIRLQGVADDVKVVTSGQWLRQPSAAEDMLYSLLSILVHLSAGILFAATREGKLVFLVLVLSNTFSIELANSMTDQLLVYGRTIRIARERKAYGRRLEMAEDLVEQVGNDNWCEKMGIILTKNAKRNQKRSTGPAHM